MQACLTWENGQVYTQIPYSWRYISLFALINFYDYTWQWDTSSCVIPCNTWNNKRMLTPTHSTLLSRYRARLQWRWAAGAHLPVQRSSLGFVQIFSERGIAMADEASEAKTHCLSARRQDCLPPLVYPQAVPILVCPPQNSARFSSLVWFKMIELLIGWKDEKRREKRDLGCKGMQRQPDFFFVLTIFCPHSEWGLFLSWINFPSSRIIPKEAEVSVWRSCVLFFLWDPDLCD